MDHEEKRIKNIKNNNMQKLIWLRKILIIKTTWINLSALRLTKGSNRIIMPIAKNGAWKIQKYLEEPSNYTQWF